MRSTSSPISTRTWPNPEGYLAKNPLPMKDDLLKFNRPRTEWKFEELADAVEKMEAKGGRFANGKQMFTVATCVACHKFGGQGNEFGPDLTKLADDGQEPEGVQERSRRAEHILEPAKQIDDKYAMYRIVLDNEKVVTAMIVEEKDGVVKVIENPLASAKPLEIKESAIVERKKVATSIMPKGLLDKLTKNEILDLLAYVWGKADPKAKYFGDVSRTATAGTEQGASLRGAAKQGVNDGQRRDTCDRACHDLVVSSVPAAILLGRATLDSSTPARRASVHPRHHRDEVASRAAKADRPHRDSVKAAQGRGVGARDRIMLFRTWSACPHRNRTRDDCSGEADN